MALGPLRRSERYAQRTEIADLFGYRIWSEADRPALIEMASLLAKRDVTPTFILIEILAFLKAQKIVRPGYSALQAIVSGVLVAERGRLAQLGDVSPNRRKFRQDKFSPATIASRSITCPLSRKV